MSGIAGRFPGSIELNKTAALEASDNLGRSPTQTLHTKMSLLAPIICDNGTGYSKVGYAHT